MHNPWKLTTLLLGAALVISSARAETSWKQDALGHLESAAKLIAEQGGGSPTGKQAPSKRTDASPASKALQLTRAAIVQLSRVQ